MISFRRDSLCFLLLIFRFSQGQEFSTKAAAGMATTTTTTACPKFYFFDHGTDKCEFCCDICCYAEVSNTVSKCEALCPEYAQKLKDEAAKQQQAQDNAQEVDVPKQKTEETANNQFPLAAGVAGIVASAILLLLLLGLIIAKRKSIAGSWFRRRRNPGTTRNRDEDPEAGLALQPIMGQRDANVWDAEAREDFSWATVAQETGKPSDGENDWRIFSPQAQPPQTQSAVYDTRVSGSGEPRKAWTQESMEGRQGPDEMVPSSCGLNRRRDSTYRKIFWNTYSPMGLQESRL